MTRARRISPCSGRRTDALWALAAAAAAVASSGVVARGASETITAVSTSVVSTGNTTVRQVTNGSTNYTITYDGTELRLNSFATSSATYRPVYTGEAIIRRNNATPGTGNFPSNANLVTAWNANPAASTATTHTVRGQYLSTMEELFTSQNLWTGIENLMVNVTTSADDPRSNVERVDYVFDAFQANARQGFSVFDRGQNTAGSNGAFRVAAITGWDTLTNLPTFSGSNVVRVAAGSYGSGTTLDTSPNNFRYDIFQGTDGSPLNTINNVNLGPQGLSGVYINATDLVAAGTTIYGYAVFGDDVTATGSALNDWNTYSHTSGMSNDLDMVASGATYFSDGNLAIGWVTPALDLGAIHINGDFASKQASVDNIAPTGDNLDAYTTGNSAGISTAGSVTVQDLTPAGAPVAAITVDITSVGTEGAVTGTVTTGFWSDQAGSDLRDQAVGFGTTTVTGMIYSGLSTWTPTTGGSWGGDPQLLATHANWSTDDGAPGTWGDSFDNVDTATFGSTLTANSVVTVDGAISVKSITFNNNDTGKGTYTIAPGTGSLTMKSDTGTATLSDTSGRSANTITAPITLQSNLDVSVSNGGTLTVTSLLAGTGTQTVTKTGDGTLLITGTGPAASTYNGATTVTGGTLRVDGSITASAVDVKTGATLSGVMGNIASTVMIESGATLSPGGASSATEVSKLTTGAETWKSGGTYVATVSAAVAGEATGAQAFTDLVDMSSLTVDSGFKVSLQTNNTNGVMDGPTGFNPAPGTIYDWIIAKVGDGLLTTTLPYIGLTTNFDTAHPYRFSIFTLDGGAGNPDYVVVRYDYNAVPEATTLLLGMAGLTPLLLQRRRQRLATPQAA